MYREDKTPKAVYLLKVSDKDTTGAIESCSKWKMEGWSQNMERWFCARIDNLEQVSEIILARLLPPLNIICIWNVPFFSDSFL